MPPFAAQPSRRSREFSPPFAAQPSRRSREFTPPFADQPAHSSQEMTPPSTANPSPPARRWLNARRPASDSMPAGLPLTQARRIAADSCPLVVVGRESQLTSQFTPPSAAHRPRRSREITPPAMGKANPPSAAASITRGKPTRRPRFTRPAAGWGSLQPAGPCRCVVKPAGCCRYLSSQPIMVSPAGRCRIDKPAGRGRIWPVSDHGLFICSVRLAPEGSWYPWASPRKFWGGGSRAPAEETEVGAGAAVSEAVPPWPPELPAPPWPSEPPAPPWPPELPSPPGPRSVCSTLEAPSCVRICVGPVGSPECPPPLPGSTVTARDVPSGRGELC